MSNIQELEDVIKRLHHADSKHIESVPVKEVFQGLTVWDGTVEVFQLFGHSETDKAYAWSYETDDHKKHTIAVLHLPPVNSPETAVRAFSIVKETKAHAKRKD